MHDARGALLEDGIDVVLAELLARVLALPIVGWGLCVVRIQPRACWGPIPSHHHTNKQQPHAETHGRESCARCRCCSCSPLLLEHVVGPVPQEPLQLLLAHAVVVPAAAAAGGRGGRRGGGGGEGLDGLENGVVLSSVWGFNG